MQTLLSNRTLTLLAFAICSAFPQEAAADIANWIGGDGVWDESDSNWANNDEPDPDDQVNINGNSEVTLGLNNAIDGIGVHPGSSLFTDDYFLSVANEFHLIGNQTGPGSVLQLSSNSPGASPPTVSLSAAKLLIGKNSEVRMAGNAVIQNPGGVSPGLVSNNGVLRGAGLLAFTDTHDGPAKSVFENWGEILVGSAVGGSLSAGAPPRGHSNSRSTTTISSSTSADRVSVK